MSSSPRQIVFPDSPYLLGQLMHVDGTSSYVKFDRQEAYRNLFEDWRRRNTLVDGVIRSETTFVAAVERAYEKLYGEWWQSRVPRISTPNYEELDNLKDVLGRRRFHDNDLFDTNLPT